MTHTSEASADNNRDRLIQLIKDLAVVHGKVTLSSGQEADYYVDMRRATLHHEASALIGASMLQLLDDAGIEFDAVGGLTMGADPVATAIMHVGREQGRDIDSFVVRKAAKTHGMTRQVEGPSIEGKRVVVLDDTSTTGNSSLQAVEAVREAGANVVALAVVVDRDTGAAKNVEENAGVPYLYAIGKADLGL